MRTHSYYFPCRNAHAAMGTHFDLYFNESWGSAEIADAVAILEKVDRAYAKS